MYTTMAPMLAQAKQEGKGVPAFNIHALEVVPMMAKTAAIERIQQGKRTGYCAALSELDTVTAKTSEAFRKHYGLPPSEYRKRENQNG